MVQKEHIKSNYQPQTDFQTLKVKATRKAKRRLSFMTRLFLLKWLESEFSSSVSFFTGAVTSSNSQRWPDVWILLSILIGLTLAVTSNFVTLFVAIVFHREFLRTNYFLNSMTYKQCRIVWRAGGRIPACLLEVAPKILLGTYRWRSALWNNDTHRDRHRSWS